MKKIITTLLLITIIAIVGVFSFVFLNNEDSSLSEVDQSVQMSEPRISVENLAANLLKFPEENDSKIKQIAQTEIEMFSSNSNNSIDLSWDNFVNSFNENSAKQSIKNIKDVNKDLLLGEINNSLVLSAKVNEDKNITQLVIVFDPSQKNTEVNIENLEKVLTIFRSIDQTLLTEERIEVLTTGLGIHNTANYKTLNTQHERNQFLYKAKNVEDFLVISINTTSS